MGAGDTEMPQFESPVSSDDDPQTPSFTLAVDMGEDLAKNATHAAAAITVTARAGGDAGPAALAVEIFIMDRSASMHRSHKLDEAKRAVRTAIDALRDGIYFAVIGGDHEATPIYPVDGGLARITAETKAAAKREVGFQNASGGTAIGQWLTLADEIFWQMPGSVRHAVLYTDGINEHEEPADLDRALSACRGSFVCDARGLGTDWDHRELIKIADALHGTAEAVVTIADLTGDFERIMAKAQRLVVPAVHLRFSLDHRFRLHTIRQVVPTANDLTEHRLEHGDHVVDIPLGAWGTGSRDYFVRLSVDPSTLTIGEELQAARVDLLATDTPGTEPRQCAGPAAMIVQKSPFAADPTRFPERVTILEDAVRCGTAMRAGIDALADGDIATAEHEFATAYAIALRLRDRGHLDALDRLVTIGDDGRAHLRPGVEDIDLELAGLSTTVNAPGSAAGDTPAKNVRRLCAECGEWTVAATVTNCEVCGHRFPDTSDPA